MDALYVGSSAAQRGTYTHIKNRFGHRSLKTHVMSNVPKVYDFMNFITDGIVCNVVLQVLKLKDVSEIVVTGKLTNNEEITVQFMSLFCKYIVLIENILV